MSSRFLCTQVRAYRETFCYSRIPRGRKDYDWDLFSYRFFSAGVKNITHWSFTDGDLSVMKVAKMKELVLACDSVAHLTVKFPLFPDSHPDAYDPLVQCIRAVVDRHCANLRSVSWGCDTIDILELLMECPNLTTMLLWTTGRSVVEKVSEAPSSPYVWHKLRSLHIF